MFLLGRENEEMADDDAIEDAAADVAARFGRFAREEAPGRSDLYAEWARGIAGDRDACETLVRIVASRRQPPLVFAVARMLGAPERAYAVWSAWLAAHADRVVAECGRRSLQTNEPLRCAALLPALSIVEGPIALIEVGASAGLCLYPDRYSYRYREGLRLDPAAGPSPVIMHGVLRGPAPAPRIPEIVWRAGIDLSPLAADDAADRRFLTALAWPGEAGRAERITAALDVVAADPPEIVAADATAPGVLEALVGRAPEHAAVVVTTPGVLPHVPFDGRRRLYAMIADLAVTWITLDPPGIAAEWSGDEQLPGGDGFVLGVDGVPRARADPLGACAVWHPGEAAVRG